MGSFADDVERWADKAQARLDATVRGAAMIALEFVVPATPVAEGTARGNWQVSFDIPAEGILDVQDLSGNLTVRDGTNKIESEPTIAGRTIFLTNNLPYAVRLEQGHSEQGKHMVQQVKDNWPQIVAVASANAKQRYP